MTKAEAHEFVQSWDGKIFPWRTQTEFKVIRRLQKFSAGVMLAMFGWMAAGGSAMHRSDFYLGLAIWVFALVTGGFSFWLHAHLREAGRVLGHAQIVNRKS